jgi:hypothetical protein
MGLYNSRWYCWTVTNQRDFRLRLNATDRTVVLTLFANELAIDFASLQSAAASSRYLRLSETLDVAVMN